jgi:hypothetical protein
MFRLSEFLIYGLFDILIGDTPLSSARIGKCGTIVVPVDLRRLRFRCRTSPSLEIAKRSTLFQPLCVIKSIWNSFGIVGLKMMARARSNVGKCFRMNSAVHVGA